MKTGMVGALALAACLSTNASAQDHPLPPVEAFGSLPALSQPQLSPDGKHLAVIQAVEGRPVAVIYSMDAPNQKPTLIPSPDWLIQAIQWAKNDRLLLFLGKNRKLYSEVTPRMHGWGRTIAISPDGSNPVVLFHDNPTIGNNVSATNVVDLALDDPTHVYMPLWVFDYIAAQRAVEDRRSEDTVTYFRRDLFRVDLNTGHGEQVEGGALTTVEWYVDGHGHVIGRLDESQNPLEDHLALYSDGAWHEAATFDAAGEHGAHVLGLTDDGASLVRWVRGPSGRAVLVKRDLRSGAESELFSNTAYDVGNAILDPWTFRVTGAMYDGDKTEYRYFDPSRAGLQKGLEAAFPNLSVHAVSFNLARDKVIARVQGPHQPPAYYILDRATHKATLFGTTYPGLHEADLGEMRSYNYAARDGLAIPAYITLPPGKIARNLPAIVMPHDGPDERDAIGFNWLAQFMANRGYVVLQPNFRGSFGYGSKFTEAGLQQWGLKTQDDITDGVRKLIADGIADPKRVCIVGSDYGGYAALAGATFTPDLYACAVSVAGISDLPKILAHERARSVKRPGYLSFWVSRIGSPYDDSEQLRATSPARHADQVKCPVLLMHGDGDSNVPIEQSEIMADALKSAGKDVEFIKLEGDDHYLELGATRVKMLTELERFLKAHIGS